MEALICNDAVETTAVEGEVYGCARVSTREQNLDRQLRALAAFPVERGACSRTRRAARTSSGRRTGG